MSASLHNVYSKPAIALILMLIFSINAGYQYTPSRVAEPLALGVCDHTDSEKECEKNEKGEADEFIGQYVKATAKLSILGPGANTWSQHFPLYIHLDNPTPPPEGSPVC